MVAEIDLKSIGSIPVLVRVQSSAPNINGEIQMSETKDRPIKDIIISIRLAIKEQKIKGQFARDLEKLCVFAYRNMNNNGEM